MKRCLIFGGFLLGGLVSPISGAVFDDTRTVVDQWVEARKTTARVRSDWAVEKEILGRSLAAFERELTILEKQLGQVDTGRQRAQSELSAIAKEKVSLRLASDTLGESVAQLENRIRSVVPGFPSPMIEKIEPLLAESPMSR